MSIVVNIDGSSHTGNYRVDCLCGTAWNGQGAKCGTVAWSPALPIAEAVVHLKQEHPSLQLELRFSQRFEMWLRNYWEHDSLVRQRGHDNRPRHGSYDQGPIGGQTGHRL